MARPYVQLTMPIRFRIKQLADHGMSYPAIAIALRVYEGVEGISATQTRSVARAMGCPPRPLRGVPVTGGYVRPKAVLDSNSSVAGQR